jgi:hypothetical protein
VRRLAEREGRSASDPIVRAAEAAARHPVPAGKPASKKAMRGATGKGRKTR